MPIYEYKCLRCEAEFEELVFGDDTPACPQCGAGHSERLLSCACLHISSSSRVAQAAHAPASGGGGGCAGCAGGSCSSCR